MILLAPMDENFPTRSGGQSIRPNGANIINVGRKHNQHLFCYMKKKTKPNKQDLKTDHPNFSVQYRIHEYNFARSLFLKYRRHQVVTVDLPTPIEIKPQIFYLIFL